MVRDGQVANASVYRLHIDHPAAQLVGMLDQVPTYGTVASLLDERFIGTPRTDNERGDHPADPR